MNASRFHPALARRPRRQTGQAMIFGLFVLVAGLAGLFFLFNTGQLSAEKTKLINTADAVAYSAGVMHARALNFDAYTNRALVANEVLVAQMVSVASWLEYAQQHSERVAPLNCTSATSVPVALLLLRYEPLCALMAWQAAQAVIAPAATAFNSVATATMGLTEAAKFALQASQAAMFASFRPMRHQVMQQVADANYAGLGAVKVDALPLLDNYSLFDDGPFIARRSGADRTRFKHVEVDAAYKDEFVSGRGWTDSTPGGCLLLLRGEARHTARTALTGFDQWSASDDASLRTEMLKWRGLSLKCRTITTYDLGAGRHAARARGGQWYYSGVPSFFDLSRAALGYSPANADPDKREPRLRFAIRLTRASADLRTSSGSSPVKPGGRLQRFQGDQAKDVMAAVASSEVYFDRPGARVDGRDELASLFNPFWQAHLIGNSAAVRAAALTWQEP